MKPRAARLAVSSLSLLLATASGGLAADPAPWKPSFATPYGSQCVQAALDEYCEHLLSKFCAEGKTMFCNTLGVARYDVGNEGQSGAAWRCYAREVLDMSVISKEGCADNSGVRVACLGKVKDGVSSRHTTQQAELKWLIDRTKTECTIRQPPPELSMVSSGLQRQLDVYCQVRFEEKCSRGDVNFCDYGGLARYDVGSSSTDKPLWRCYADSEIKLGLYNPQGCADDAARKVGCYGRVSTKTSRFLDADKELTAIIDKRREEIKKNTKAFFGPL